MATPSTSQDTSSAPSAPRKYNLRNPLPLSASQEQEVKQLYYKRVRSHCAPEIKGIYFQYHMLAFLASFRPQPCLHCVPVELDLGYRISKSELLSGHFHVLQINNDIS